MEITYKQSSSLFSDVIVGECGRMLHNELRTYIIVRWLDGDVFLDKNCKHCYIT